MSFIVEYLDVHLPTTSFSHFHYVEFTSESAWVDTYLSEEVIVMQIWTFRSSEGILLTMDGMKKAHHMEVIINSQLTHKASLFSSRIINYWYIGIHSGIWRQLSGKHITFHNFQILFGPHVFTD